MAYLVEGSVATITLDHPENRNALTQEILADLTTALTAAEHDATVRAVVLTNTGPVFCAGADLKASTPGPHAGPRGSAGLHDVMTQIQQLSKPVVARIAGHCAAGGVGLAAACDLSVAADDVWFGFTEVRIGVAPIVISVVVLPKLRLADASELFLTGERVPATRAAAVGLINRSVPRERLDDAVREVVDQLLLGGPVALATVKELLRVVPTLAPDQAYPWTTRRSAEVFASLEATSGIEAFRAKSSPPWVSGALGVPYPTREKDTHDDRSSE